MSITRPKSPRARRILKSHPNLVLWGGMTGSNLPGLVYAASFNRRDAHPSHPPVAKGFGNTLDAAIEAAAIKFRREHI